MSNYGNPPQDPYGQQPDPQQPGQDPYAQPGQAPAYGQPDYGQQPGQTPAYGQMPAYGQPAYPQGGDYGQAGYGAAGGSYAHWGKRVGATLIDSLIMFVLYIPAIIGAIMSASTTSTEFNSATGQYETITEGGSAVGTALTILGLVLMLGFWIWNYVIKQGKTGYTIGKGVLGIKLIGEQTGQPIGPGMSFVRQIAHFLDQLPPCLPIGYLWPLWDAKRQTFADKILNTVVIDQPKG